MNTKPVNHEYSITVLRKEAGYHKNIACQMHFLDPEWWNSIPLTQISHDSPSYSWREETSCET